MKRIDAKSVINFKSFNYNDNLQEYVSKMSMKDLFTYMQEIFSEKEELLSIINKFSNNFSEDDYIYLLKNLNRVLSINHYRSIGYQKIEMTKVFIDFLLSFEKNNIKYKYAILDDISWMTNDLIEEAIAICPNFINILESYSDKDIITQTFELYGKEHFLECVDIIAYNDLYNQKNRDVFFKNTVMFNYFKDYEKDLNLENLNFERIKDFFKINKSLNQSFKLSKYIKSLSLNQYYKLEVYDVNTNCIHNFIPESITESINILFDAFLLKYNPYKSLQDISLISIRKDVSIPNITFAINNNWDIIATFPKDINVKRDFPEEYDAFLKIKEKNKQ